MLSSEYPPETIGGLSTHVYFLSHYLSRLGNEVHVISCKSEGSKDEENDRGVFVHRVEPYDINTNDFVKKIMHLNFAMAERAVRLINEGTKFDVIHSHDWLSFYSAKLVKCSYDIPLVVTIHATEYGRNNGIRTDMQKYISSVENKLCHEACRIIACSNFMGKQINGLFNIPWDKIRLIPNGVDIKEFEFSFDWLNFRRRYAKDDEKIIFFIGRHVFEKGIQLLIEASPIVIRKHNNVKFVIAGLGPMTEEIKDKVKSSGLSEKFLFTGYMDEDTKNKMYRVSNAAVFPSLYEPFGIVALEAMASKCPVVVSDTGGFSEIVKHEFNGLKAISGVSESIADNILRLLDDPALSERIKNNAYNIVKEKYSWSKIAESTASVYRQLI